MVRDHCRCSQSSLMLFPRAVRKFGRASGFTGRTGGRGSPHGALGRPRCSIPVRLSGASRIPGSELAVLRSEQRTMPIYALTVAKGGSKLVPADARRFPEIRVHDTQMTATAASIKGLIDFLSLVLNRPVVDETGLGGVYDFKLSWTPDLNSADRPADDGSSGGPSIFTAMEEQLGPRLESNRGPTPVYVIVKIEKPSEN
jgi:hypothetical protein